MKIREIVESTPMGSLGTAVGKAAGGVAKGVGAVAGGAVGAAGQALSGYKAGQDKMAKLLNPSRWFEKKAASSNNAQAAGAAPAEKAIPQHVNRELLLKAGQSQPLFLQDYKNLKTLLTAVQAGKISTQLDQTSLVDALKSASRGKTLSEPQQQLLLQFAKQY